MEEFNINEMVKVESLGVIKQQLDTIEEFIDQKVKDIPKQLNKIKKLSFTEQEEEKQDIKKYQRYLSSIQKELEDKRKEIKKEINKPYEEFNEYYSNGVYKKLDSGIKQLKEVINEIEDLQKDEKRLDLKEFAEQHIEANNLSDIIGFDDIPLNITLSASMKSLEETILAFIKTVSDDLECISSEENKVEILYEYKRNGFKYNNAVMTVRQRYQEIEKLNTAQEKKEEKEAEEQKVVEKVEEIIAPKEIIEDDEVITVTFTITDTKENIIKVREFMKEEGIKYD